MCVRRGSINLRYFLHKTNKGKYIRFVFLVTDHVSSPSSSLNHLTDFLLDSFSRSYLVPPIFIHFPYRPTYAHPFRMSNVLSPSSFISFTPSP